MKKILTTLILTFAITGLFAQEFEIPKNYVLDKAEDYAKYEKDIINCIDWLMLTPINENPSKRKEANAFLIMWLTGAPNLSIGIRTEIVTFLKPNAELLIIFMGGWTKFALESGELENNFLGNLNGVLSVIDFYEKNRKNMKKDKNVIKYIKMKNKGTLKDYIKKNI